MKINRGERRRVSVVFFIFLIWLTAVLIMLVKIQVFGFTKYLEKIKSQSNKILTLHPKRGTIFDRNKDVLAISILSKSLFITNKDKKSSLKLLNKIGKNIIIKKSKKRKIRNRINSGKNFIWIKRKLTENEFAKTKSINPGKYISKYDFIDEYKRIYPNRELSGHVLGGVGVDEQGLAGIEFSLDSVIKGKGGKISAQMDARSKIYKFDYIRERVPGKNLYLTIDSTIQFFVQEELKKTIKEFNAKSGSVIVMNSKDGSILAMASFPYYDPSNISYTKNSNLKNNALSFLYYPGSTFKIILAASALKRGVCSLDRMIRCYNGSFSINNLKITDDHPHSELTFNDVIVFSSNIGAAQIGLKIGNNRLYNDIKNFGIGAPLLIRLPAKEKGILNPLSKWDRYSAAYISYGYEVYVTPIQMIRAFNIIASGGYLVEPKILKSIDGVLFKKGERRRIVEKSTSWKLVNVMVDVVQRGTGKKASIPGIRIAGKTGTAKKYKNDKFRDLYVASFGGFFPAENPKITMFVVIDEPKGSYYGGDVAAPLFKRIAERIILVKGVEFSGSRNGVINL